MKGSGSLQRLVARGLMLVAALLAMCAFHASSEPGESAGTATSVPAAVAVHMVGPLHVDLAAVPSTYPSADHHAHLAVVSLLGFSLSLVLLELIARARQTVSVLPHHDHPRPRSLFALTDPPWSATPSLTRLSVSRT